MKRPILKFLRKNYDFYSNGARLSAEIIGPPEKNLVSDSTLVFLHQGLGSIAQWKDFPLLLSLETNLAAVIYDRAGYGSSDPKPQPRNFNYLYEEAQSVLPDALEQFEIDSTILIGHSDGGSIALLYAGLFPEKVQGIITEAAHVFVEQKTVEGIKDALAAFDEPELRNRLVKYHGIHTDTILQDWEDIWLNPDYFNWNIESSLSQITAPTLVIQGENDQYGTLSQVDAIVEQVSGPVEKFIISECGHSPHLQAKQLVLERMSRFVNAIVSDRSHYRNYSGSPST